MRYCLDCNPKKSFIVAAGGATFIELEAQHHVALLDNASALLEFHRAEAGQ